MKKVDFSRRLTELEKVSASQNTDDEYWFNFWLALMHQIDPYIIGAASVIAAEALEHSLPKAPDPACLALAGRFQADDPNAKLWQLYQNRAWRAEALLGGNDISILAAAARCNLQIDGPRMDLKRLLSFRARVLASPQTVDEIRAGQF
jgi:hypothetical protein